MNDSQPMQNQRVIQAPIATPAAQKIAEQPSIPSPSPASSSSAPTKEHAPTSVSDIQVQEVAQAPELTAELKEAGIEEGADAKSDELPEEVKKAGVTPAKESVPLVADLTAPPLPALPMTYDEAVLEEKKEKSVKSARRWKITEILRELKKQLFSGIVSE